MRKALAALLFIGTAAACGDFTPPVEPRPGPAASLSSGGAGITDKYIVVFGNHVADAPGLARQLAAAHGASVEFTYQHALKGFSARMSSAAAEALARNPVVAYVEADQVMEAIGAFADDPPFTQNMDGSGDPWGLDRIDARSGLSGTYSYSVTGSGVVAYIIDTGILPTHTDLSGRVASGYTAITDGRGTTDCNGHGTHVAGTVGGTVYGVAKGVTLVPVRVLNCSGSGTTAGVIAGVDWVTSQHTTGGPPAVANMSLGGGASTSLDAAVRNSIAKGVGYAVAAGNGNMGGVAQDACKYSPARVAEAMTIGATTKTDSKTSWSNYGTCVDWFAPGSGIKSAWHTSNTATNTISGTSMAAPHVAGAAALYLQANPGATPQQVRDGLYAATTKNKVTSSSTANNHLLYSPPTGFGDLPEPPPPAENVAPTANFSFACSDLSCNFTDLSTDTDGSIASWAWDFGDAGSSTAKNPSFTFTEAGAYEVMLTVTDNGSPAKSASVTKEVTVSVAPPPPPPPPSDGELTVTTSKTKGTWTAILTWSGLGEAADVDIYRNNVVVATVANSGSWSESAKGGGTFTYRVCAAGTATCTNSVTVSP